MKKNSIKNTRINGEVQRELSQLINREIKDPRINQLTSVIAVEVAPDLKHAKVYISVLGDDESRKATLAGLKSASPFMRSQLAKTINLRNTPELEFVMDQSIEYGVNMSKLIDKINNDTNSKKIEGNAYFNEEQKEKDFDSDNDNDNAYSDEEDD
jgi:ribosome-binding factor A